MTKELTPRQALEAFAEYFEQTGKAIGLQANVVAAVPKIARSWADRELGPLREAYDPHHGQVHCSGKRKTDGGACGNWGYPGTDGTYWCNVHKAQANG